MAAGRPVPFELCTSCHASLWDRNEEATEELLERRLLNLLSVLLGHGQFFVSLVFSKVREILNRVVAQLIHLAHEFRGCILDVPEIDQKLHQLSMFGRSVRDVLSSGGLASHDGNASCFLSGDRKREEGHEYQESGAQHDAASFSRGGGRIGSETREK